VDKCKLARSAAAGSIFNCPTLTLILIISVFRSLAAFIGVFFIDGILPFMDNVTTLCNMISGGPTPKERQQVLRLELTLTMPKRESKAGLGSNHARIEERRPE
jgi:hypothetical protein